MNERERFKLMAAGHAVLSDGLKSGVNAQVIKTFVEGAVWAFDILKNGGNNGPTRNDNASAGEQRPTAEQC